MGAKTAKRLGILIAVIGILGVSAYFIRTYQITRMAQSVVERAELAEQEGKYDQAVNLYNQHLRVVPKDTGVKVKLAGALLKQGESAAITQEVIGLYEDILRTQPQNDDVRRKVAMLYAKSDKQFQEAQYHLGILLQKSPNDSELEYQLGRCLVGLGKNADAERELRESIEHSPKQVEAYKSLADLLRGQMQRPQEADKVVDEMVKVMDGDPKALLVRGMYRSSFDPAGANDDFQKALKLNPKSAEIYIELARLAQQTSKFDDARKVLEDGLKNAGDTPALYQALATASQTASKLDQAIADLRRGLKAFPENLEIRWHLAILLIAKGDANALLEQIEELKSRQLVPPYVNYLTAHHLALIRDWPKARQQLNMLQAELPPESPLIAGMNELLARCLGELGDPEAQEAALRRAITADPKNLKARIELIQKQVIRGDVNQAIAEYTDILKDVPQVWSPLARLIIYRNLIPQLEQDWKTVENLIDQAEKREPDSAEPAVMRAELLIAQRKPQEAAALLDQTRRKYPKSIVAWTSLIDLKTVQLDKPEEGLKLYEEATKELGDRFELRLERARILAGLDKSGSEAEGKAFETLGENLGAFSSADRRRLLEGLGNEAFRAKCMPAAYHLFQRAAEEDPTNLTLRWRILNLAFNLKDMPGIDRQIEKIKVIEGANRLMGPYSEAWKFSWLAEQSDVTPENAQKYRTSSRTILDELISRRPDWSVIPLAYATLEEQELKGQIDDPAVRSRLRDSLVNHYLQAISGGQRDLMVVRRAAQLLFEMNRYDAADQMLRKLPSTSFAVLTDDFKRMSVGAAQNKDFEGALEFAKKAVAAKPEDFRERFWLAEVLKLAGRLPEAEAELQTAVRLAGRIADPWIALIRFLAGSNQLGKAEAALRNAETTLPKDQLAIAMAQSQEILAKAYEEQGKPDEAKARIAEARKWYLAAEAEQPKDPKIRRLIAAFFVRNAQLGEVQSRLRAILASGTEEDAAEVAWARRTLALMLITTGDKKQAIEALDLFKDRAKTVRSPEDQRTLVQLLLAQKSPEQSKEAIDVLAALIVKNEATADDRMLLAQLYLRDNDWPKAQKIYKDLLELQPDNRMCRGRYAAHLIARVKPGASAEATEAEKQIALLKQGDPDWEISFPFTLELELLKAKGENDKIVSSLNAMADKSSAVNSKIQIDQLGQLAEKLGLKDLAEKFFRSALSQDKPKPVVAMLNLAAFLGRTDRLKEAVDLCEKAQGAGAVPEEVARISIGALFADRNAVDKTQAARIAALIEKGIQQRPQSAMMVVALGNVRERQQQYDEAKSLYQKAIEFGSKDGVPLNNLAWLTALKDNQGKTALGLINRAIDISGPIPDFLDTRGVAYLIAGENQRAIEDLEKAVAGDATSPSKLVHLAQAYFKAGDKERAKKNLDLAKVKGLELNSLHPLELVSYNQLLAELAK